MEIREIDVQDDEQFHRFYEILRAAELFERPDLPTWSEAECAIMFRRQEPGETWHAYAAFDRDDLVGASFFILPLLDNTNMTWQQIAVAPQHRRRGIGSALSEHFVKLTRDAGRDTMLIDSAFDFARRDDHPHRRFAEKNGYSLANVEIRRMLELPVATEQLDAWAEEAAPKHTSYTLETYVDGIPDELLESYLVLYNSLIVDAPTGDIDFEPEAMTPEAFRQREAKVKEMGRTVYCTVAIDEAGEAVAHSVLSVPSDDPITVYQWATLVRKDHRGYRLGLATKVRNLKAVQDAHPERTRIFTCNAEVNDAMIRINEQLGFKPIEIQAEFQRKLC